MIRETFRLADFDDTIRTVLESGGEFRMYPRGRSMLPMLREGIDSVVLVSPGETLEKGDIALYLRADGHYVLHRVVDVTDGVYTMCGDNQVKKEPGITRDMIIGVVSRFYRGEKCADDSKPFYKFYKLIWKSFFIRRVYGKMRAAASYAKRKVKKIRK